MKLDILHNCKDIELIQAIEHDVDILMRRYGFAKYGTDKADIVQLHYYHVGCDANAKLEPECTCYHPWKQTSAGCPVHGCMFAFKSDYTGE